MTLSSHLYFYQSIYAILISAAAGRPRKGGRWIKVNRNLGSNNKEPKLSYRSVYAIKYQAYIKVLNKSPALRFVLTAFAMPLLATYVVIWVYSDYSLYLPGKSWRVNHDSGQTVLVLAMFFSIVAGWPTMLCLMMPFLNTMRRRRKTNLVYFLLAGFAAGVVISTVYFTIIFSWRDAVAYFYPTVTASTFTMFLAWITYIVGDPEYPFDASLEVGTNRSDQYHP